MIVVASRALAPSALRSVRAATVNARRRCLQTAAAESAGTAEAYLEPVQGRPGIVSLLLNRPKAKNAISMKLLKVRSRRAPLNRASRSRGRTGLSPSRRTPTPSVYQEFQECLDKVQFDKDTRVLIVRSSTVGSFCAGADLIERASMSKAQVDKFLLDLRRALGTLERLPVPTIAAIDGPALGGGLELGLACDLRVAGHSVTKIGLPEVKLGIIPGAGGTQRLTRLLGLAKAKDLIFTARIMTAQEAHQIGVVDYVSDPEGTAVDKALELAAQMSANAPLALKAAKQAISRVPELGLESGLDFERASYEPLLHTKDRLEALQAFKEKRAPVFKGE
ncbi:ClpP/crotonase [Trametes coccinea BRFM310]|uniref:ClpP/crotonase n=1 Tax=Trametes coccinea (strain BRFM310) TaxID=1353009 RepID=A0A1Y2ICY0_TRAC3|nr:ClpP/crotonase [Trametes coccinea BRFM310]